MAPARHETYGAGSPETPDTTSPTYGTRSSKRKVSEMSANSGNGTSEPPSFGKRPTRNTRKSAEVANETSEELSIQHPTKKRRSSNTIPEPEPETVRLAIDPETPEEIPEEVSDEQEAESPESGNDVPEITVSVPGDETSPGEMKSDEENFATSTPVAWDDLQVNDQAGEEAGTSAPPARGRGCGGFRGGRRGKRGGAKAKSKQVPKPVVLASRGRRRGGRRKASVNPRIDALNARSAELKAQYNAIAKIQKQALDALAEKSLNRLTEDPNYHESVPEHDQVMEGLKEEYEKRLTELKLQEEREVRMAEANYHIQKETREQQFHGRCEAADEEAIASLKEHAMYVWHQAMRADQLDEFAAPKVPESSEGKLYGVTQVNVKQYLHPFATPYSRPQQVAVPTAEEGDTVYLQHPATQWRLLDAKGKRDLRRERDRQHQERVQAAIDAENDKKKPSKKRKREALFQPMGLSFNAADVYEADEDPEGDEPTAAEVPLTKAMPAKPEVDNAPEEDDYLSSDAEEYAEDGYGLMVPRKRARWNATKIPNNRIRYPAAYQYEDWEIGHRQNHYRQRTSTEMEKRANKNDNLVFLGIDASPNRPFFYSQQVANAWNSAMMTEDDFDQQIIKAHKLHPRFGLPIKGSINPDRDEFEEPYFKKPTDWSQDLPAPESQRIVEHYHDGTRKFSHSSRSWVQEVDQKWEDHQKKVAMFQLLSAANDHELINPGEDTRGMTFLAEAVTQQKLWDREKEEADRVQAKADYEKRKAREAAEKEEREARAAREAARISAFGSSRPTSSRYDPVRDTTYQTPYPRTVPPPRPAQHGIYRQGGPLSALADMADFGTSTPQFTGPPPPKNSFPRPGPGPSRGGWVEPPVLPTELPPPQLMHGHPPPPPPQHMGMGPPPPQMSGLAPNNFFQPQPQPPPFQSSPSRANANQGNLRPLQPAPPRGGRRTTPPQPQNRGWYGN